MITDEIDELLKNICIGISERYEIVFLEIGAEKDHVHLKLLNNSKERNKLRKESNLN